MLEYGSLTTETPHLTSAYVVRILQGQNPAELPVQMPTRTRLILNLRIANALGLTLAPTLLASADEVID